MNIIAGQIIAHLTVNKTAIHLCRPFKHDMVIEMSGDVPSQMKSVLRQTKKTRRGRRKSSNATVLHKKSRCEKKAEIPWNDSSSDVTLGSTLNAVSTISMIFKLWLR